MFILGLSTVQAQNAPEATADTFTVASGFPTTIDILANDSDPDGGSLGVLSTSIPVHGVVTTGLFTTYQSNMGYIGLDSFIYVITDVEGLTDTASVYINVITPNINPVSKPDTFYLVSGLTDTLILNSNDYDPDGNESTISWLSASANSSTTIVSDTSIAYTAMSGFSGTDSLYYFICDDGIPPLCSDTTLIYIELTAMNNAPIAVNDVAIMNQNDSLQIDILLNDEDPDGDALVLTSILTPAVNGTYTIANDKLFYTPDLCFYGSDSLEYLVCDDQIPPLCDSAWLYIDVTQIVDIDVSNDNYTMNSVDTLVLDVQANDSLYNGLIAATDIIQGPVQGLATILNSDSLLFEPIASFIGVDTIIYQLCDACEYCDTAIVTIAYIPPNVAPVAEDDVIYIFEDEDSLIAVLDNDFDPFGTGLTLSLFEATQNGTLSPPGSGAFLYQPNPNFFGTDTFSYIICAPTNGLCDTAEVIINIESVDDPPIAGDDNVNGIEDQVLSISVLNNDVDIDSYPLHISILSPPASGVVNVLYDQEIQYIPNLNFIGTDQLSYLVCDTVSPILCDTAIVTITILGVNDPPYANDDMASTLEDNILIIQATQNDSDPDGDEITGSFISLPQNGSAIFLNGDSILYNPNLNFNGLDSLTYIVCDDIYPPLCDTAVVYIDVLSVNDKPTAINDNETTEQGYSITIDVQDNDSDVENQPLMTAIVTSAFGGIVSVIGSDEVVYLPSPGYVGNDQFSYSICDNGAPQMCDTALVYVTVTENPSPIAVNDTAYTDTTVPVIIDALGNDFDPNDTNLSYSVLSLPSNGITLNNFNGTFTYTSDPGFLGWDSFTYFISDDGLPQGEDIGTVYIYVDIPNESPIAVNDTVQILEGDSVIFDLLGNDSDPDGDSLYINFLDVGSLGNLSLNSDGTILYEGIYGNSGIDIISYEICDSLGLCASALLVVDVLRFDSQAILNKIPNAITPNDDGYNDTFIIPDIEFYSSKLEVYDRWGIKVFGTTNYQNNWAGTYENSSLKVPSGTYYFTIQLSYASQAPLYKTGYIQILN